MGITTKNRINNKTKAKCYIFAILFITTLIPIIVGIYVYLKESNIIKSIFLSIIICIPISEIVIQFINYILSKIVKPKIIPKLDLSKEIPKDYSTFVVIPTIVNTKEKVRELIKKLEIYYLANKSDNLYFALLGDCTTSKNKNEKNDKEIIETGIEEIERLNEKYKNNNNSKEILPKFSFLYRKRVWNNNEECYLGWERKRGLLCEFNEFLINEEDSFLVNTLKDYYKKNDAQIKYVITLDSDTELIIGSASELIGAMAHILNKPILNEKNDCVIDGHAIIQPRVGINMEASNKTLFTKLYSGLRRNRFIYKCYIRYLSR